MILPIQTGKDNKILRAKSQKVADFRDPKIQKLIIDMKETLSSIKEGVGLAAPQIGKNIRIFILSPELSEQTVFINPIIRKSFRKTLVTEGCLSLPKIYGKIKR
ncbi:MAG: Peptide deformylase, partial [Parcubacteria group bacterium GW2011_GWE2_37_8]